MFSVKITGNIFFVPVKEERYKWSRKKQSVQLRRNAEDAVTRECPIRISFARNSKADHRNERSMALQK